MTLIHQTLQGDLAKEILRSEDILVLISVNLSLTMIDIYEDIF